MAVWLVRDEALDEGELGMTVDGPFGREVLCCWTVRFANFLP